MFLALRGKFDSKSVLRNISRYGFKNLLPAQRQLSIASLPGNRISPAKCMLAFKYKSTGNFSMLRIRSGLGTISAARRSFHTTRPLGMFFGGGRPPFKVYRISPMMVIFAGVGFFVLAFTIVPLIFTFFLPLFIGTVVICQFNKWRRNVMLQEVKSCLKKSSMRVSSNTVRSLHFKSVENLLKAEQRNVQGFRDILKQFDPTLGSKFEHSSAADANRLLSFINDRLLEAIESDEQGIRTYFLGNNVDNWVKDNYELELDTNQYKTNGRMVGRDALMVLTFPLYLKSANHPRKHLANVSLVVSDLLKSPQKPPSPFPLQFLSDTEFQMVLSIRPISLISTTQFILTTQGRSGDMYSKYDIQETPDHHTEYTIRSND